MVANRTRLAWLLLLLAASAAQLHAGPLDRELGRSEVRILSAPYHLFSGITVQQAALPERLDQLGYRRVRSRPTQPGSYFWGHETFWIYRNAHRLAGREHPPELIGLRLRKRDGMILGPVEGQHADRLWLEPLTLAESLEGDRAVRRPIDLSELPEHVWRPVLAAEDARFFDHVGLDGRAMARAMLANAKAGTVAQGGSTITQQLIKNRDLTPKRTFGRKASEAVRALALEVEHDKRDILDAYLDQIYLGHVEGLAIHGLGTAARVYFSKNARDLTLPEAATLAAMIQGPNRLSPIRHPQRVLERRNWVLGRMAELGWSSKEEAERARAAGLGLDLSSPERAGAFQFLDWVASTARENQSRRLDKGRGLVVETTLDPYLQMLAERAVEEHLRELRRSHRKLRTAGLSAALVALDASTGMVLAYVGGDPADGEDRFDRARKARRQTGSTIKPLLLLEAFEDCGDHKPLHPATRVADEYLRIDLPGGAWEPTNYNGRFHGTIDVRFALRRSLNVPFVRVARWCGVGATADRIRQTGLTLPPSPPISFILGAVEASPLEMAGAYTVFASPGRLRTPFGIRRIERPSGRRLASFDGGGRYVVHASSAYLVRDLMRDAVARGTGSAAAIEGLDVAGKTGTSSSLRDAWFVGDDGGLVTAVWIGLDKAGSLGLTGSSAAAPLWKSFMERASASRPTREVRRPPDIVVRRIDPDSGLRLSPRSSKGREELFRRRAQPRKDRFLRPDRPEAVIH